MTGNSNTDVKVAYEKICAAHDGIVEFRAKLLALLPIASGVGILLLTDASAPSAAALPYLLPVGIFGALITLGLFIYELRGIQTCNDLIASAKQLEYHLLPEELVEYGRFNFRLPAMLGDWMGNTGAGMMIYTVVFAAWVYLAGVGLTRSTGVNPAVLVATFIFALGFLSFGRWTVQFDRKQRDEKLQAIHSRGEHLREAVRILVEAENIHSSKRAEPILSPEQFVTITRSRGKEQELQALLDEIEHPKNASLHRELCEDDFRVWSSGNLAIIRSLVKLTDTAEPGAEAKRFRNLHVFQREQGAWQCILWQVTELKTG